MVMEKKRRPGVNWQRLGLRLAGAGLLAVTGAIHLDLYLTGYRSIPVIGWLFGQPVPVERRLAEIHDRYGSGHLVSRSIQRATRGRRLPLLLFPAAESGHHVDAAASVAGGAS